MAAVGVMHGLRGSHIGRTEGMQVMPESWLHRAWITADIGRINSHTVIQICKWMEGDGR